jgi:hypothetical protein
MSLLRGNYQRRVAIGVLGVHIGVRGEQGPHHLQVAISRSIYQRRIAIGVLGVHISFCGEQSLQHFQVAKHRR